MVWINLRETFSVKKRRKGRKINLADIFVGKSWTEMSSKKKTAEILPPRRPGILCIISSF